MDYNHIGELLERYWQGETSLKEEAMLRAYFAGEVHPHLLPYRDLFIYQQRQQSVNISDGFEARVMAQIETKEVKVKRITFAGRFVPLFKAAVMIAIFFSVGAVLQRTMFSTDTLDYDYNTYTDTYDDPGVAYKQVSSALMILSESLNKSKELVADSIAPKNGDEGINQ